MLERLDRAFTSQRQFIANASYELRTPLTVMDTAIDVVVAKPEPTHDELVSMAADVRHAVDHAERYNIAGGTVAISTTAHDATSVLRVVNTGAVVPTDMVERLFLPFTRLDDGTRHDGFGLGLLTLVSSIAAVHRGTVDATAMPTGGPDITVRLPRRERGTEVSRGRANTCAADDYELGSCVGSCATRVKELTGRLRSAGRRSRW
jgi:signal transduction histidine kinase